MQKLNIDCLVLILDELTDKKSLYPCLLVNKEWCNVVVQILWKRYSWNFNKDGLKEKFFNIILSCLPSTSRQFLFDNDIKLPSTIFLKPPLFNYISFCKFPEVEAVKKIIDMVLSNSYRYYYDMNDYNKKKSILEREIYLLFISQCKDIKELNWQTIQPLSLFPGAPTCFSQLNSLSIDIDLLNSNALLYEMAQICKSLDSLSIHNCSKDYPGLISLIDAQRNLKKVYICTISFGKKGACNELSKALARRGNTIDYLYLAVNNIIPLSFLTSLVNLKWLIIYNKYYSETAGETVEDTTELQQYLSTSEFPDLQYLRINNLSCFKEISLLIEKTKGDILDVYIYDKFNRFDKNAGMLIKAIAKHCPQIKSLRTYIKSSDAIHVKSLLLNCNHLESIRFSNWINSYYLRINNYHLGNGDTGTGDELLDILTKFSPKTLTDISISGYWVYYNEKLRQQFFEKWGYK